MKTSVTLAMQQDSAVSPFPAVRFEEGLDWAKNLGVEAVELSIPAPEGIDVEELDVRLARRNLEVSTLATGLMATEGLIFCAMNSAMRKAAVNRICRHIDLSTKLPGHPNVTIGLVRGKGGGIDTDLKQQHQWIVDCLKICAQYAKNSGVTLNLEPFNRYESFHLNDVFSAVSMIQEIGCPANVGILYDTFHANIEERDMQETILTYGKNFSHIHFADSNRRLPGEGHIDYGLTMQALHGINYQGYISLECVNAPNAEHVMEYAGNFVSLAKN